MERRSFGERIRPWIPALLWLVVIACESTGLFTSENTARWLWQIVTSIFGPVNPQEFRVAHGILRKVGHFVGYGMLGYFFFVGWRGRYLTNLRLTADELRRIKQRLWRARWSALAIVMTFAVAALDEFHQTMLPGRTGVFRDVLLDTLGGVFAQWLVFMSSERRATPDAVPEKERVI